MSALSLLGLLNCTWMLWGAACIAQKALVNAHLPKDQRGRVSLLPVIPVFPLLLWGVARFIDMILGPWGSRPWGTHIIGSLHAAFALVLAVHRLLAICGVCTACSS